MKRIAGKGGLVGLALVLAGLVALIGLAFTANPLAASLRSPGWWDPDGVGSGNDWHYRVPVTMPSTSSVNSTGKVDVDFAALMTQLGITGTFDPNSVRVVRPNGTLATIQEYTDSVYAGATDSVSTRGEVRWIVEDGGVQTYYIYFDITQNGAKPVNGQTPINGNFEQGSTGTQLPPGWGTATKTNTAYDMQIRPSETVSVTSDGIRPSTGTGPLSNPFTTDGTPFTGNQSYMMGARTNNEPTTGASQVDVTMLTRTIAVPATNPGSITLRWRVEGWDSDTNNVTTYDHLQVELVGSSTVNIVGPLTNDYKNYPFSPNYSSTVGGGGASDITSTTSGYGDYNSYDRTTTGTRKLSMTVANHSQQWWSRTYSLSAYAGQTITLRFSTTHFEEFKSWFHIDDVEWSVVAGTLGAAEGFGVSITAPSTTQVPGQTLSISTRVDARPTASTNPMTVDVYNNAGTLVATGIKLYNDGTHGDATANDAFWTNNGSDAANPTYTIPIGTASSTGWTIRAFARDASSSTQGAANNGLVHRNTLPATAVMANYWNIDEITFNVVGGQLSVTKVSTVISDPVNGTTQPKAIPGAVVEYCILVSNVGATTATTVSATDPLPTDITYAAGTLTSGASCAGATTAEDDNNIGTDESDPYGAAYATGTVTAGTATLNAGSAFAIKFRATVN